MKSILQAIVFASVIGFAVTRPFMPLHAASPLGTYEAMAHVLVGGLFGAWFGGRVKWCLYCGIGLSVLEVICATVGVLNK